MGGIGAGYNSITSERLDAVVRPALGELRLRGGRLLAAAGTVGIDLRRLIQQQLDGLLRRGDQVLDHRGRDRVAMERGVERRDRDHHLGETPVHHVGLTEATDHDI